MYLQSSSRLLAEAQSPQRGTSGGLTLIWTLYNNKGRKKPGEHGKDMVDKIGSKYFRIQF